MLQGVFLQGVSMQHNNTPAIMHGSVIVQCQHNNSPYMPPKPSTPGTIPSSKTFTSTQTPQSVWAEPAENVERQADYLNATYPAGTPTNGMKIGCTDQQPLHANILQHTTLIHTALTCHPGRTPAYEAGPNGRGVEHQHCSSRALQGNIASNTDYA